MFLDEVHKREIRKISTYSLLTKQKTKNFDERIWDRLDIILEQWDDYIS